MTVASVWKNETVKRIMVEGHSKYAEYGYDIVCSSISTAMILSANLICKLTENCNVNINEEKVIIDIAINENEIVNDLNKDSVYKLLETLLETLEDIHSQYPKYLKIRYFG